MPEILLQKETPAHFFLFAMNIKTIRKNNKDYLKSVGIDVPGHLPLIEDFIEVSPKSATEVASRLCALSYIIGLGYNANRSEMHSYLNKFNLLKFGSKFEQKLLKQNAISNKNKAKMAWQAEYAQVLAWSISLVELDHVKPCDDDLAMKVPFKSDPFELISCAILKPITEVQKQSDLIYLIHWYVCECQIKSMNCKFNPSIIKERRKAIDWVYGVDDDWDEIN